MLLLDSTCSHTATPLLFIYHSVTFTTPGFGNLKATTFSNSYFLDLLFAAIPRRNDSRRVIEIIGSSRRVGVFLSFPQNTTICTPFLLTDWVKRDRSSSFCLLVWPGSLLFLLAHFLLYWHYVYNETDLDPMEIQILGDSSGMQIVFRPWLGRAVKWADTGHLFLALKPLFDPEFSPWLHSSSVSLCCWTAAGFTGVPNGYLSFSLFL